MSSRLDRSTVSSDLVRVLLRGLPGGSETLSVLLAEAGIDPDLLDATHARIPVAQFDILWRSLESAAGDPDFGLHLGELSQTLPSGHVLTSAMLNSARVVDALRRFCRYHDLMADMVRPRLLERGDEAVLRVETRHAGVQPRRHHVECIAALLVSVLRQLTDSAWAGELRFSHPPPADITEHVRILGPSVLFAQPVDELVIPRDLLERPIAAADAHLLGFLDDYAELSLQRLRRGDRWSNRVSELLSRSLCDGRPVLADVARGLSLSPRSLQAHLQAEGTSFQALLDEVRQELALAYLSRSELTQSEITFLLGFADQSAFSRAVKKWTGVSPSHHRKRALTKAGGN